jgi:hypothetical protein
VEYDIPERIDKYHPLSSLIPFSISIPVYHFISKIYFIIAPETIIKKSNTIKIKAFDDCNSKLV